MDKQELNHVISKIRDEFWDEDVSMSDFLATTEVPAGMTFEDAFEVYIKARKWADHDHFYIHRGDEPFPTGLVELPQEN